MSISSSHGRRVALSSQDLQHTRSMSAGRGSAALSSKPGVNPARLEVLGSQSAKLAMQRKTAFESVRQLFDRGVQSIKSRLGSGSKNTPLPASGSYRQVTDLATSTPLTVRELRVMQAFQRLENRFAGQIPQAENFLGSQPGDPQDFQLFEAFAQAADLGESVEFLLAVRDFRSQPSVKRARDIVKTFIEPSPVDDFGMPVEDKSKRQINMSSDEARKQLMRAVESCISKSSTVRDGSGLGELIGLFDLTEANIRSMLIKNFNSRITELTQANARSGSTPTSSANTAFGFA